MASTNSATKRSSNDWAALSGELDRWSEPGQPATFWWRDDDVTQTSKALDRLLELADSTPLALAAIPMSASPTLAKRLADVPTIMVMQHGYAHANHAPSGEKKAEFGKHRPVSEMVIEIARGAERLHEIFQNKATTTLVPPWNRIADEFVALLPDAGITALSSIGSHHSDCLLPQVNVHVDIIDWRGHRGFVGSSAIDRIIDNLSLRRSGEINPTEATGLLTHHLDHDEYCWNFVADLMALTEAHPAARWMSATEVLAGR